MNPRIEGALSIVVTLATTAVAATYLYGQFFRPQPLPEGTRPPEYVNNWAELRDAGTMVGPPSASIQIIEFTDFQCPFCARFHGVASAVQREYGEQVNHTYLHYPLTSIHPHADAAARAAECSGYQGRFGPMVEVLFTSQDSIGIISWGMLAARAGVADTAALRVCMASDRVTTRLAADRALVNKLSLEGTPTVMVNGWRLPRPPTLDSLRYMVSELVAGRSPFPSR